MKIHGLLVLAVVSLFLVAEAATQVQAQPGGGRQRGGQRGGPGGGGPGFGGFGGGGLTDLLRIDAVAEEIELSDEQKEQIDAAREELRGDRGDRGNREDRPNFGDMSEEEREKFVAEMRERGAERAKAARAKLAEILMDDQLERLDQISIQRQGIGALMDPTVAEKLKLSEETKKELQEAIQSSMTDVRDRMRELFQGGDREGMREKMLEIRKEIEGKVLGKLSSSQKMEFEKLKGEPFEMPQRSFGGRGGDRGGQQRGQRGGAAGGNRPQRPE